MSRGLQPASRIALAVVVVCTSAGVGARPASRTDVAPASPPVEQTPPATAQQTPPPAPARPQVPQQPTFRAEANYVRVDVIATTKDGVHVQDLSRDDFEVLEDRKPQEIATFEHVLVQPAGPQSSRMEPNTVRESREMAGNPRGRTFVLFLDNYHVNVAASHSIRGPIVRMLDRIIGQDDLVGVMTPEMSATDVAFARKTETIDGMLEKHWPWGVRHSIVPANEIERQYEGCFPDANETKGIAKEMGLRRREMVLLDSLGDLLVHLQTLRDERKAVLVFSEGWALYRRNESLSRLIKDADGKLLYPIPGTPEIGVTGDGRITAGSTGRDGRGDASLYKCETDRMHLANLDNERTFLRLLDDANRANVTFYPVDPRGLPVFDSPIGPDPPPTVTQDAANLRNRLERLHDMASATDGIAVVNNNDVDRGLKRVSDDLSSYYLLGYYSTNTKLDGSYRAISVKTKKPGLEIRARRGYRAATADEIAKAKLDAPPELAPDSEAAVLKRAIDSLASARVDLPVRIAAAVDRVSRPGETIVWVTGEIDSKVAQTPEWKGGGTAAVSILSGSEPVAQQTAALEPGARTFVLAVPAALGAGEHRLQVRATPASEGRAVADGVAIDVPAADRSSLLGRPLLFRKGPSTGGVVVPTADVRFRRAETIRLELPAAAGLAELSATLLGRDGQPSRVPVAIAAIPAGGTERTGTWLAAQLVLAPLAAGDYAIAVSGKLGDRTERLVLAFRVIQ